MLKDIARGEGDLTARMSTESTVAQASEKMSATIQDILEVTSAAQEISIGSNEINKNAQSLSDLGQELGTMVGRFKVTSYPLPECVSHGFRLSDMGYKKEAL